jgi:hypothetical protein
MAVLICSCGKAWFEILVDTIECVRMSACGGHDELVARLPE